MKESVKRVIDLTKLFGFKFTWKQIVFLSLLYPLMLGGLLGLMLNSITRGVIIFILLFSFPALFLGLFGKLIFTKAKLKHVMLASSIGGFIYSTLFFIFYLITFYTQKAYLEIGIIISGLLASLIWYFVGSVFFKSTKKSAIFGFIQFIFYISLISMNTGYLYEEVITYKYILAFIVFTGAIGFTYYLISIPLKKNLGYSGIEMMQMFFAQWIFNEKDLEKAFNSIGKRVPLKLKLLKIGNTSLIAPSFHYGPFGTLCSSNFPSMVKKELNSTALHSTATHDLNLANSREKKKALNTLKEMLKSKTSPSYFSFSSHSEGDAKAYLLDFSGNALLLLSRAPKTTEDIEYSAGLIIEEKLKKKFKNVAVVDMHNSEGKDITYFDSLSKEFREYVEAAVKTSQKRTKKVPLKHSHTTLFFKTNKTLGKAGISIHCFDWNKPVVMLVIDGNSIKNECRETLENTISSLGAIPLVLTTDTHEINNVRGVVNEYNCKKQEIEKIKTTISHLLKNMKRKNSAFVEKEISLKVLGKDFSVETISTLNSSLALARIIVPIGIVFSILVSLYVINLL